MDFSVELTEFPSAVHKCIYSSARGLTPLERSLVNVADPDIRSSCIAFHGFVRDMLSDMYDHPEIYGLPVGMLEDFCGKITVNGMKQRSPSKAKTILSQTRNSCFYIEFLYILGEIGTVSGNTLIVSEEDMELLERKSRPAISPIPLDKRLAALARVGLSCDGRRFASERHSDMFPAMSALAKQCAGKRGFEGFAFRTLDFRC
ncbi:MAG: hypothetical protein LBI19_01085 [Oscillospiraceae bacterium]|nr:hypothetical protein [Oscillospiraceae bacterium]